MTHLTRRGRRCAGIVAPLTIIAAMWTADVLGSLVVGTPKASPALSPALVGAEPAPTPRWQGKAAEVAVRAPSSARLITSRKAARSRSLAAPTGRLLSVTCYVATGNRTASGVWPQVGMAAGNRWDFGTRLNVEGIGVVTVTDRIGHSSDLDLFYADRAACLRFGRHSLHVEVVR